MGLNNVTSIFFQGTWLRRRTLPKNLPRALETNHSRGQGGTWMAGRRAGATGPQGAATTRRERGFRQHAQRASRSRGAQGGSRPVPLRPEPLLGRAPCFPNRSSSRPRSRQWPRNGDDLRTSRSFHPASALKTLKPHGSNHLRNKHAEACRFLRVQRSTRCSPTAHTCARLHSPLP